MTTETILFRRAILDWRDDALFDADITLTRLLRDVEPLIAEELEKASLWTLTARPAELCSRVIDPLLQRKRELALQALQARAQTALRALWAEPFAVALHNSKTDGRRDVLAAVLDLGSVGGPIAVGVWAVLGASTASVSTVAVWLGLGTVATVSMPILAGGVAVAAVAGSLGFARFTGIKKRSARRQEAQIMASVQASLLGEAQTGAQSALSAFSTEVERITAEVLRGTKDDANLSV